MSSRAARVTQRPGLVSGRAVLAADLVAAAAIAFLVLDPLQARSVLASAAVVIAWAMAGAMYGAPGSPALAAAMAGALLGTALVGVLAHTLTHPWATRIAQTIEPAISRVSGAAHRAIAADHRHPMRCPRA